jgi:hypothetical protein
MPTLNTEQTISYVIGAVVVIPAYQRLEAALRAVITALDEDYYLLSEDANLKGALAKYGILDLTFQHQKSAQLLKVYCEAAGIGYFPHLEKSGEKFDMDAMYSYVRGHLNNLDTLFPLSAQIMDCCLTTDPGVWDEKHFYS